MDNTLYENLISPYTIKVVDTDNGSVCFNVTTKTKVIIIPLNEEARRLHTGRAIRRINTPHGEFLSILEASRRLGIPTQWLYHRCANKKDGYSFIDGGIGRGKDVTQRKRKTKGEINGCEKKEL